MHNSDTVAQARALLARMLANHRAESIVDALRAVGGPITMLKLHIIPGASKLAMADGAITGFYVVDDRGSTIGELILWIEDGLPSILEYAWYTDNPPTALPEPTRVVSKSLDR